MALQPSSVGGTFRVWLSFAETSPAVVLWDRKADGGFPDPKELKQRVRARRVPCGASGPCSLATSQANGA